jgi:hypothetical protein
VADTEAVGVGEVDVEQHQVVRVDGQAVVRLRRVAGHVHRVAGADQAEAHGLGQVFFVFHHEQAHG